MDDEIRLEYLNSFYNCIPYIEESRSKSKQVK